MRRYTWFVPVFLMCFVGPLVLAPAVQAEPVYKALNPRAIHPDIKLVPLSPRVPDLKNKTVYIINIGKPAADILCPEIETALKSSVPEANIVYKKKQFAYMTDEPNLWKEVAEKGNAAILAIGD
jgi:hypothetical protein